MKVPATLQFLGTGSSWGVPVIGCQCAICQSAHPKNRRSRPSALLKVGSKAFLIDAGPDLREQALRFHIDHLDGVLLTHTHYDHTGGIDDLRIFYLKAKKALPCLLSTVSAPDIRARFAYMLRPQPLEIKETPRLKLIEIGEERGERVFEGIVVRFFSYKQLEMPVLGFRFGSLAYVTDIKAFSGDIYDEL
ncbi:MAG: MBL fold metallo-hydrolase, partial [Chlamydiia bacterium]|nr:MBL fold metallo-hydrolase [Chlamydiia bacterium]